MIYFAKRYGVTPFASQELLCTPKDACGMSVISIHPGDIVKGPRWSEPLQVDLVEPIGEKHVRLVGVLLESGRHVDQVLTREQAAALQPHRAEAPFSASPREVFLALEARRYRFASLYDPLLAVNISKVDPLPHQIEAVYGYILHRPVIRFLIADDPGAGKTIMAGLVIKEMKLRGLVRRILIVSPGHLKDQWRREMKERFEEPFVVVDRHLMRSHFGENVWEREFQVITSLDFARQEDVMASLSGVHWDLIIVDEAHKMAAYRYGRKVEKTKRYRLGEMLSQSCTHLLFLTATPHRGDPENFRLFLDLLQPGAFATKEMLQESIRAGDNPLFIRRIKEDLKDFDGKPLFLPRHVKTLTFDLGQESPPEKDLYNSLSRYVREQYNKALAREKRRNIAFALLILQRRLASSTYALYRSLQRRKTRLEELLREAEAFRERERLAAQIGLFSLEDVEEMSEEERWEKEALWETLSVAENRQELEREIRTLDELLEQAKQVIQQDDEVKLRHFKAALDDLRHQEPGEKILIFTESRDTLDYLERRMREWGYSVCTIHGGMPLEKRIEAESIFKNQAQVMVATEAAGEGINLQFCHLMVNYDLPWNPNRLEQRMGRIHRYGQTREVTIFNLVAADTREGQVMARLFEKLDEIRAALGSDKVFDVVNEIFPGRNLAQLMVEAAAGARRLEDILSEIDVQVDQEYLARIRENLGESLATRYIDYTRIREMAARAREHRLIPEYTQAFFQKAWEAAGGQVRLRQNPGERAAFFSLERIPAPIRSIGAAYDFQKRYGALVRRYPKVTFDKDIAQRHAEAEFVSFGHPLFEAVLAWVEQANSTAPRQGATFTDPDGRMDGVILFYEGEVSDGLGQTAGKRLFALYADRARDEMQPINPAVLWDLEEGGPPADPPDLKSLQERALAFLIPQLEAYQAELAEERRRQAEIKRKYGVRSLDYLIVRLDGELLDLYDRQARGQQVDLVIRNKKAQKEAYERALRELKASLKRESELTLSTPRFLGAVRVVPAPKPVLETPPEEMRSSAEIERLGMEVTMRHEREHGRRPEDVSAQNLGFDVRSTDPQSGAVRYIEVKARAGVGPVALTQNEWFKAQRFGEEYYLYVVLNAATRPELYIVRDPARVLTPTEKVEVRYLLPVEAVLEVGKQA